MQNILIVDDEKPIRLFLKMLLTKVNPEWNVLTAENGEMGIETCKKQDDIDLILMDIDMPGIDGILAIQSIRCLDAYKKTPIIILTGVEEDEAQEGLLDTTANALAYKPIVPSQLISIVNDLLEFGFIGID